MEMGAEAEVEVEAEMVEAAVVGGEAMGHP